MLQTVHAKSGALIRLTDERWGHIAEEHAEMAGLRQEVLDTVAFPEALRQGFQQELLALRAQGDKTLVVVYKETGGNDGFIITAFLTSRPQSLAKRKQVWP